MNIMSRKSWSARRAIAIANLPPRKMMGIDSEGMLISAVHEEDGRRGPESPDGG